MTDGEVYEMKIAAERLWVATNTAHTLFTDMMMVALKEQPYMAEFFEAKALPVFFLLMTDLSSDLMAAAQKLDDEHGKGKD